MSKSKNNNAEATLGSTIQVNFKLDSDAFEKVKDLAFWEGCSNAEIYNKSIIKYLELFEEKHGKIKPRPPAKGLDSV